VTVNLSQVLYTGVTDLTGSDHRPIAAAFEIIPKPSYKLPQEASEIGALEQTLLTFGGTTFEVAQPPGLHPKLVTLRYDNFVGPLVLTIHAPFLTGALTLPMSHDTCFPNAKRSHMTVWKTADSAFLSVFRHGD
jgi:hypothetical protein